jgi:metallo-beta-lactamase family protein
MAIESTRIYQHHRDQHRLSVAQCEGMAKVARISRTADDSRAIGQLNYPVIIISASGMATGGRVLHHLVHMAPDHRNSIVFAGYQAGGTRGAKLVDGARSVRIFGDDITVNAEVVSLPSMSAHADATQILDWLKTLKKPPRQVFITHGEAEAADALRWRIEHELGWSASVPLMGQHALIDAF